MFLTYLINSLWLQEWTDYMLAWNASDYGELQKIRLSPKSIWTPDVLLYNRFYVQLKLTSSSICCLPVIGAIYRIIIFSNFPGQYRSWWLNTKLKARTNTGTATFRPRELWGWRYPRQWPKCSIELKRRVAERGRRSRGDRLCFVWCSFHVRRSRSPSNPCWWPPSFLPRLWQTSMIESTTKYLFVFISSAASAAASPVFGTSRARKTGPVCFSQNYSHYNYHTIYRSVPDCVWTRRAVGRQRRRGDRQQVLDGRRSVVGWPLPLDAAGNLRLFVRNRHPLVSVRRAAMPHEVRIVDLRRRQT